MKMSMTKNEWKEEKSPRIVTEGTNRLHVEEREIFRTQKIKMSRFCMINKVLRSLVMTGSQFSRTASDQEQTNENTGRWVALVLT